MRGFSYQSQKYLNEKSKDIKNTLFILYFIMTDEEKPKIKARAVIEVLGKPKEHIENTINKYIDNIKEDNNFDVLTSEIMPAKEQENGMFSTFAELDFNTKQIENITAFCFDYMPSSIEIMEPEKMIMKSSQMSDLMNDLQSKLHMLDMAVKKLKNENIFLKKNTGTIIKNMLTVALLGKKLTKEQLAKGTGINEKEIEPFLELLIKEGRIQKKEDNLYVITRDEKRDNDAGTETKD